MLKLLSNFGGWLAGLGPALKVGLAALVIIAGMGVAFKIYHTDTQKKLDELKTSLAVTEAGKASAEANLEAQQEEIKKQTRNLDKLNRDLSRIRREAAKAKENVDAAEVATSAASKPLEVEAKVNEFSEGVFGTLESISDPDSYDAWKNEEAAK
jgi:chromosome segregation ATPase